MGHRYFMGVDVGSASVRVGIFNGQGRRLAFVTKPIQQFQPRTNFVEQSSADIWEQACAASREAVGLSGVDPARIAGIGFDATCSLVAVGEGGKPVSVAENGEAECDIVMWMDHRAAEETAAINATRDPALAYVGGEVSIEMEMPKLLWLKRHFPERFASVWRFFDLADYLVWRATDADVASVCTLTCKWNYLAHEQRFPAEMLNAVDLLDVLKKIPAQILPLGVRAGELTTSAAQQLGLPRGIPVASGIIDAHAGGLALVGAHPDGTLALIGGTSNCHMVASREAIMVPGVWGPYFGAMVPGLWLNEGGQSAAGALIDWTLRQHTAWADLQADATAQRRNVYAVLNDWVADLESRETHPSANLHVLPDHHGNRSPRADPAARGSVVGLTLENGRDALARLYLATIQALAYGTRHIIEQMNAAGHRIERVVMCGGGTKNALLLREHADAIGCDIHLVTEEDAVTLGAALLGAAVSGAFADLPAAAAALVQPGGCVKSRPETCAFHDAKYQTFLQMYDDQKRIRERMAAFER